MNIKIRRGARERGIKWTGEDADIKLLEDDRILLKGDPHKQVVNKVEVILSPKEARRIAYLVINQLFVDIEEIKLNNGTSTSAIP